LLRLSKPAMQSTDTSHTPASLPGDALPSVLLLGSDIQAMQAVAGALMGLAHVRLVSDAGQDLARVRRSPPDLVLIDAATSPASSIDVLRAIKADTELCELPVLLVTGAPDLNLEHMGLQAGVADFVPMAAQPALVQARVGAHLRLKALADALRRVPTVDGLTGLANRRAFDAGLRRVISLAQRNATPLSLMVVQVDHFGALRARQGAAAADHCLQQLADTLSQLSQRPHDQAFRFTDDSFAVLLPGTDLDGAALLAQRLLAAVDGLALPHAQSAVASVVTVSCGLCIAAPSDLPTGPVAHAALSLLQAADEALQAAQQQGRGHVRWVRGTGGDAPIALWPEAPLHRAPGWPTGAAAA
jgi:diguanylate cyclase (GGDEF)-like protein